MTTPIPPMIVDHVVILRIFCVLYPVAGLTRN